MLVEGGGPGMKVSAVMLTARVALWCKRAKFLHERFLRRADSLGLESVRSAGLSRVDFAFDSHLPVIDYDEDSFVTKDEGQPAPQERKCADVHHGPR
ncbi:MAG: hypothetical protein ABIN37_03635 [Burkholderiaceae bacterium]